jgi:hypothetical protein
MGMVRRQNEALTSDLVLVLGICQVAEGNWGPAVGTDRQVEIEDTVCFILLAFGAGLRGEEVPLVNLKGLLTFWMETCQVEDQHIIRNGFMPHIMGYKFITYLCP